MYMPANTYEVKGNYDFNKLKELSYQYSYNAPGYYSYPTIVDFHEVSANKKTSEDLIIESGSQGVSLYIHIPFCQSLCYYCGCHKEITQDISKGEQYISHLMCEMYKYRKLMQYRHIESVHLGGGSPNFLTEKLIIKLISALHENFYMSQNTIFSIEVDSRTTSPEKIILLSKCGFERISFGVQDFHENVQHAINRLQDFKKICQLIDISNKYGFKSINIDIVYGLPLQTVESFQENINIALKMKVSRLTITKYSHMPAFFPSQRKLEKYHFPDELERLIMFFNAKETLQQNGYKLIGLDHFANDKDPLFLAEKQERLVRNFLGYEVAYSTDILGLGLSAISNFNGSYFQNSKSKSEYYSMIENNKFPVKKIAFADSECKIIWSVIHHLLCYKYVDLSNVIHSVDYRKYFQRELEILKKFEVDGLVSISDNIINVTDLGSLFLRNICSVFDFRINDKQYHNRFSTGI